MMAQSIHRFYPGFESGLSVLDMLLNCGAEKTREIVMDDNNYTFSEWNKKNYYGLRGKLVESKNFSEWVFLDIVEKNLTDIVEKNQDKIKKSKK